MARERLRGTASGLLYALLACGLVLAACGGRALDGPDGGSGTSSSSSSGGGSSGGSSGSGVDAPDAGAPKFFATVRPDNGLCMPEALPVDARGYVACRLLEILAEKGAACVGPGLSPVSPATAAALQARTAFDPSLPVCELAQIPRDAWIDGTCASVAQAGWCFVTGPAAGSNCPQAIRLSPDGQPAPGVFVILGCS